MREQAILYLRVSSKAQADSGLGMEAQESTCTKFCIENNMEIVEIVREQASGGDENRAQLKRALRLAKKHKANLVVARLCRLSRSVAHVSKLMEQRVPIVSCEFGMKVSPMIIQIFSVVAEEHRRYISLRTKEALAAKKARGEWVGNKKWREMLVDARVANIALADQFAIEMKPILDGLMSSGIVTYKGLAEALNMRGIKTRSRKPNSRWYATSIKNILMRIENLKEQNVLK